VTLPLRVKIARAICVAAKTRLRLDFGVVPARFTDPEWAASISPGVVASV
jgi:hypothetical protein